MLKLEKLNDKKRKLIERLYVCSIFLITSKSINYLLNRPVVLTNTFEIA
jgi:hypothetical protein